MYKVLFVATIHKHFRAFHVPYMRWFKKNGWKVDVMAGGDNVEFECIDDKFQIDIQRTPFSLKNIKAYKQAKSIIDRGDYDLVYCHTAMGAVIARFAACHSRKRGKTKVIYVAHGFHFFKGSPKSYWLTYYLMEKFLSRYTDAIVTINREDYDLIKNNRFKNLATYKIDGIGIDASRFFVATSEQKTKLKIKNNIKDDAFVVIYIAEYIHRKNHKFIIDAMAQLISKQPNIRLLFAGRGVLMEEMKKYAEYMGVDSYIDFLGFRTDIPELVALSDVGISASKQEGLPMNILECMMAGLPFVATRIRGHVDVIVDDQNGYTFTPGDTQTFVDRVVLLSRDTNLRKRMGEAAIESVQKFRLENSIGQMANIFNKTLNQ